MIFWILKKSFSCFWLRILYELCSWVFNYFFKWADYTLSTFFLLANAIFIEHLQHTSLSKSSFSPSFFLRTIIYNQRKCRKSKVSSSKKKSKKLHNSYKILNQQWLKNTFFQYSKCHSSVNIWLIFFITY